MKTLNQLLKKFYPNSNREYALEKMVGNEKFIPLLIQYISNPIETKDLWEDDDRVSISEALGTQGGSAIPHLIKLYENTDNNLSARFYAVLALSIYNDCQSGQIEKEVHHILLESLESHEKDIRRITTYSLRHSVVNIRSWIKFFYLEYQEMGRIIYYKDCLISDAMDDGMDYFNSVTEAEIQQLKKLFETANEEEIIGISIVVCAIFSKKLDDFRRQLLLKVKKEDKDIKKLLINSLSNINIPANKTFLTNLKTQETSDIKKFIDDILEAHILQNLLKKYS